MAFITKHWFLILLVILLLWAVYTANRVLAFGVAIAATVYLYFTKLSNPIFITVTVVSWLISALWGSDAMQSVYKFFTGKDPNPPPTVPGTNGATGP